MLTYQNLSPKKSKDQIDLQKEKKMATKLDLKKLYWNYKIENEIRMRINKNRR